MATRTRRRYEGPLAVDPRITRLLRVHLRLPRVLVECIVRAQCCVQVRWYSDGSRDEIPIVRGKRHGTLTYWRADGTREREISYVDGKAHGKVTWWRADGTRDCEIPFVRGERHGTATWWRADGSRWYEIQYANSERHGTTTYWRADGTVERTEEW